MKNTQIQVKREELKQLYQEVYLLTEPLCKACRVPQSCCSREYCELALEMSEDNADKQEQATMIGLFDKEKPLPYMRESGCIVPPHLRPLCTLHHCAINGVGFFPKKPRETGTYFHLREEIERLEFELATQKEKS